MMDDVYGSGQNLPYLDFPPVYSYSIRYRNISEDFYTHIILAKHMNSHYGYHRI